MKKLRKLNITNTIIKLFFFLAFPAAWSTGFAGFKYLCQQIHEGKPIEMKAFLIAFIALISFTIVFGRFFCGRACAFGTYGDVLHWIGCRIARRIHRKLPAMSDRKASVLRYAKYAVLIVVGALCIAGYGSVVSQASPWSVFAGIRTGSVQRGGILDIAGVALFAACSVGMILFERFFCRFLCPFGAVFSLLPVMPWAAVSRSKEKCLRGCSACRNVCPAHLDLPYYPAKNRSELSDEEADYAIRMGECFQCGRCAHICPKTNAGSPILRSGTAGIIIDIFKAVLLAAILYKVI